MVEIKVSKFSLREREVGEKKARKEINIFGSSQHTGLGDWEVNDGLMGGRNTASQWEKYWHLIFQSCVSEKN